MSIVLDNSLSGEPSVQVTDATLAASAEQGTVTIEDPDSRAVYSSDHEVYGLGTVLLDSGHHRLDTPRMEFSLPSAPWAVRVYVWLPSLQAAGHGTNEVRVLLRVGTSQLIANETTAGSWHLRWQPMDLAAARINPEAPLPGPEVPPEQWVRLEVRSDGTDTTGRVYEGHDDTDPRIFVFSGHAPSGSADLTAYRYRIRPTLQWGSQGSDVTEWQEDLIDMGYDLSPWGADGDYGQVTHEATEEFQTDFGLVPVDGVAGPETRAAADLELRGAPPASWLSHLAVSDDDWVGAASEPPPEPAAARLVLGMPI